jgi:tRNA pseudouridine31 synthase
VLNLPIAKIFEDDEIVCIDKPPSLPVHPCGAYNKNSLVRILELEDGLADTHRSLR